MFENPPYTCWFVLLALCGGGRGGACAVLRYNSRRSRCVSSRCVCATSNDLILSGACSFGQAVYAGRATHCREKTHRTMDFPKRFAYACVCGVCVCVYVCMWCVCMCVCGVRVYVCIDVQARFAYMCVCGVCVCVYVCMCVRVYVCIDVQARFAYVCVCGHGL